MIKIYYEAVTLCIDAVLGRKETSSRCHLDYRRVYSTIDSKPYDAITQTSFTFNTRIKVGTSSSSSQETRLHVPVLSRNSATDENHARDRSTDSVIFFL